MTHRTGPWVSAVDAVEGAVPFHGSEPRSTGCELQRSSEWRDYTKTLTSRLENGLPLTERGNANTTGTANVQVQGHSAALSRNVQRPMGARLSAMLCMRININFLPLISVHYFYRHSQSLGHDLIVARQRPFDSLVGLLNEIDMSGVGSHI